MELPSSYGCNATGFFPQYGAIFMANTCTRKECFGRRLFGLPPSYADFVMKIKMGMILFLFDYQERKLYGVFEALSDGTLNISSKAYKSSGKQFPAQVLFLILWRCIPIPEAIFRYAIKDNYYAPYKFHFGLSKQQVWKLCCLFEKTRVASKQSTVNRMVYKRPIEDGPVHIPHDDANPCLDVSIFQPNDPAHPEPQVSVMPGGMTLLSEDYTNAEPVCEDTAVKDASQDMAPCEPEDFIPLPSPDPAEIDDIFPDGFADGWDLDLFADCGLDAGNLDGIFDTSPFRFLFDENESLEHGESVQQGESLKRGENLKQGESSEQRESLEEGEFLEDGESISKPDSQPLGSSKSEEQDYHTLTHSTSVPTSECQVKGLYSDSEVRTSVFSRLKGAGVESWNLKRTTCISSDRTGTKSSDLSSKASISSRLSYPSRATFRKDQRYTSGGAVSQIMERLEKNHRRWEMGGKKGKQESGLQYNVVNSQGERASVFSRLNGRTTMEVRGKPKYWASLVKDLDNLQCKVGQALRPAGNHECNVYGTEKTAGLVTEEEAESVCLRTGMQDSPKREEKRRRLDGQFSGIMSVDSSAPTRDCESSVLVPPENADAMETSGSCEGSSKSNRVDGDGCSPFLESPILPFSSEHERIWT
ncbi:hypothetical protein Drorol1_Dr00016979 [Drosera rotundifolia]